MAKLSESRTQNMLYLTLFLAVVAVILGSLGTVAYHDVAHNKDDSQTMKNLTLRGSLIRDGYKTGLIKGSATVPVTADTNTDITLGVLPANTRIKNLFFMFNSTVTTAAAANDDLDFSLGIAGTPGSLIDQRAIAQNAGAAVTITADTYYYLVKDGVGADADALDTTGATPTGAATSDPQTNQLIEISNGVSTSDRTLVARFTPKNNDLAASGKVTVLLEYESDYSA